VKKHSCHADLLAKPPRYSVNDKLLAGQLVSYFISMWSVLPNLGAKHQRFPTTKGVPRNSQLGGDTCLREPVSAKPPC